MDIIGKTFRNKATTISVTCKVLERTKKGYKVLQTQTFPGTRKKPHIITAYHQEIFFHPEKGC